MPPIGQLTGPRTRLLSRRNPMYRDFLKETGIKIDFNTFKKVIRTTCKKMAEAIASEPEGIQLPGLGYIIVHKYKPKKIPLNRVSTKRMGKNVPFLNLHSFGYMYKIMWYRKGMKVRNITVYNLKKDRTMKKALSDNIKKGVQFFKWTSSDLWAETAMDRRFNNSYQKDN